MHKTGGAEVLSMEQLHKPVPKAGQVVVKVRSISINFADVLVRRGHYPYMPDFPATPGACSRFSFFYSPTRSLPMK